MKKEEMIKERVEKNLQVLYKTNTKHEIPEIRLIHA